MEEFILENNTEEKIQVVIDWQDKTGTKIPILKTVRPGESIKLQHNLALIAVKKGLTGSEGRVPPLKKEGEEEPGPEETPKVEEPKVGNIPEDEKSESTKVDYKESTVGELKDEMKKRELTVNRDMRKRDLVKALEDNDKEGS